MSIEVSELWRYPVKSMMGEPCKAVDVNLRGVQGDRQYAVCDQAGKIGSGKNTRRFRRLDGLLEFCASYSDGSLQIVTPGGLSVSGDDQSIHRALSDVLGPDVALAEEQAISYFDAGPIHIISADDLGWLQSQAPDSVIDSRRFRPNIVISGAGAAPMDDRWLGRCLHIGGEVVVKIQARTERCRMVSMAQQELHDDPRILRYLVRVAGSRFGVYGTVHQPGRISLGDQVVVENPDAA